MLEAAAAPDIESRSAMSESASMLFVSVYNGRYLPMLALTIPECDVASARKIREK